MQDLENAIFSSIDDRANWRTVVDLLSAFVPGSCVSLIWCDADLAAEPILFSHCADEADLPGCREQIAADLVNTYGCIWNADGKLSYPDGFASIDHSQPSPPQPPPPPLPGQDSAAPPPPQRVPASCVLQGFQPPRHIILRAAAKLQILLRLDFPLVAAAEDIEKILSVIDHLAPTMRIVLSGRLLAPSANQSGDAGFVDDGHPVFFLDEDRTIVDSNKGARELLCKERCVSKSSTGKLRLTLVEDTNALDMFVKELLMTTHSQQETYRVVRFDLANEMGPNFVGMSLGLHSGRRVVLARVHLRKHKVRLSNEVTQAVFGLTETEAQICTDLARGYTAREIAERGCVDLETVRWHIKNARDKMSCRNQLDLVRLILIHTGRDL